jgi:hypothetical protein
MAVVKFENDKDLKFIVEFTLCKLLIGVNINDPKTYEVFKTS